MFSVGQALCWAPFCVSSYFTILRYIGRDVDHIFSVCPNACSALSLTSCAPHEPEPFANGRHGLEIREWRGERECSFSSLMFPVQAACGLCCVPLLKAFYCSYSIAQNSLVSGPPSLLLASGREEGRGSYGSLLWQLWGAQPVLIYVPYFAHTFINSLQ